MRLVTITGPVRGQLLAGVVAAATGWAFPSNAADLWEVFELAQRNDPVYAKSRFELEARQELVPQARSSLLPFIDAGAGRDRRRDSISGGGRFVQSGDATFNRDVWDVLLSQPVYDKASWERLGQARQQAARSAVDFQASWEDLAIRTANGYFRVLAARDNLNVVLGTKRSFQRQLELATERLDVGLGTQTDVFEAEARFQLSEAEEIEARNLIEDTLRALAELTGDFIEELSPLSPVAPLAPPDPDDVGQWLVWAQERNAQLRAQKLGVEIARREIDIRRAGHYPTVDLDLTYNHLDSDGSIAGPGVDSDVRDLFLRFRVPIYAGGLVSSRTREAASLYDASREDLESLERSVERALRFEFLEVSSSIKRVGALEQSVRASESAVKAREEGFAAGLNTNREVLDAQRDLFQAQRDLLVARYSYIQNVLELERLAGRLDPEDLHRVNSWLQ